ncbi:hypothetical protein R7Z48_10255 [Vibrio sp. 1567]|uniref:hypothetical protein n=1 Tax=Vibrio sp. 1567 TaxID=3074564 RepID=UPI002964E477|nr:hypothetical protein [Vibrio sp. 1567]MDW2169811.1 hypothetical protein [Vibrio sp. 1567]
MSYKAPLFIIFILAPFYPWLGYVVSNKSGILGAAVGGTKDLLILSVVVLLLVKLIENKSKFSINVPRQSILFIFWFVYVTLHVIGHTYYYSPLLILDGIRYLWLYCLLALFVLIAINPEEIPLGTVQKIVMIQFCLVLLWGVIEFLDPNITVTLYGLNERADMYYAKYGPKDRIIASFINPIIYGAFLCFGISCYFVKTLNYMFRFKWVIFWVVAILGFGICILTLSRLATICYFFLLLHFFVYNLFNRTFTPIYIISGLLTISIPYVLSILDDFIILAERLTGLFDVETYSGNLRITRMDNILNYLDNIIDWAWGLGIGASFPGAMIGVENSMVTSLVELGIVGLLCYVLIIIHGFFIVFTSSKIEYKDKIFFYLVFFVCLVMGVGNDFIKIFPFSFYFWFFYAYVIVYDAR